MDKTTYKISLTHPWQPLITHVIYEQETMPTTEQWADLIKQYGTKGVYTLIIL